MEEAKKKMQSHEFEKNRRSIRMRAVRSEICSQIRSMILLFAVCAAAAVPPRPAFTAETTWNTEAVRRLRWVWVEIEDLDPKLDHPERLKLEIINDVAEKLKPYGIRPRFSDKSEQIPSGQFLRIHVHKIELERTVYLSSVEWILKDPKNSLSHTPPLPRYTKISNQRGTVRQKINYMLNEFIRDWIR